MKAFDLDIFKDKKKQEVKKLKEALLKRRYTRMDEEVWRPIERALMYEVSNYGRVRSWKKRGRVKGKRREPVILHQSTKKTGEMVVNLFFDNKFKSVQVKRLVYDTFNDGYRHPNTVIMHKDGDKSNNRFDNLILAREFIDLPDADILSIRIEFNEGSTKRALCEKFHISLDDVDAILSGEKGKWAGGTIVERKYKRKLTPEEIEEIKRRAREGNETEAQIGKSFGIREQRVSRILNEKKHKFRR
ncbi:HNH endonuclease [bacterium]|nr:HNH endonuclease [bacterium]